MSKKTKETISKRKITLLTFLSVLLTPACQTFKIPFLTNNQAFSRHEASARKVELSKEIDEVIDDIEKTEVESALDYKIDLERRAKLERERKIRQAQQHKRRAKLAELAAKRAMERASAARKAELKRRYLEAKVKADEAERLQREEEEAKRRAEAQAEQELMARLQAIEFAKAKRRARIQARTQAKKEAKRVARERAEAERIAREQAAKIKADNEVARQAAIEKALEESRRRRQQKEQRLAEKRLRQAQKTERKRKEAAALKARQQAEKKARQQAIALAKAMEAERLAVKRAAALRAAETKARRAAKAARSEAARRQAQAEAQRLVAQRKREQEASAARIAAAVGIQRARETAAAQHWKADVPEVPEGAVVTISPTKTSQSNQAENDTRSNASAHVQITPRNAATDSAIVFITRSGKKITHRPEYRKFEGRIFVVRVGDTLATITHYVYGFDATKQIVAHNPQLAGNGRTLSVGMRLLMPINRELIYKDGFKHHETTSYRVQNRSSIEAVSRKLFNTIEMIPFIRTTNPRLKEALFVAAGTILFYPVYK